MNLTNIQVFQYRYTITFEQNSKPQTEQKMTSKFPSSDHYRAEVAQMEDDADTHNHQNDIGGGAADMVCIPSKSIEVA
jgi:hypothetical protein